MAKTIKMCDMTADIAVKVFQMLNGGKIRVERGKFGWEKIIITNVDPLNLVYPEGWYYAKGCFRNKHNSTSGVYEEVMMVKANGDFWADSARYCTNTTS